MVFASINLGQLIIYYVPSVHRQQLERTEAGRDVVACCAISRPPAIDLTGRATCPLDIARRKNISSRRNAANPYRPVPKSGKIFI